MIFPKNILIVRTDRIGDVVLSVPLAGLIKKAYPDCKVTFLLREYTKSLAEGNPYIDKVLVLKERQGKILFSDNVRMLRSYRFDTSLTVYPTFITSIITYAANIKNRIGTGYRWYSFFFNYKVYEHRKYAEKHELEFNVNMLKQLGIETEVNKSTVKFDISAGEPEKEKVKEVLEQEGVSLGKPLIIVHPGSGGSAVDLPLIKFRELIERISASLDANIILTGSESEKEICMQLLVHEKVHNLAGKFNLGEMKALIGFCDIFIANSTGPLHIAAAMGKYIIGFYPRIRACSVDRWGPYTTKAVVFSPEIDCTNCTREQCAELKCMNTIDVSNIFAETEKIYKLIAK